MKSFPFLLLLFVTFSFGCYRKMHSASSTVPSPATTTTITAPAKEPVKPLMDSAEAASGSTAPTVPVPVAKPMIIVDARGNFAISAKDLPPDASPSILNNENARAYTPAELQTISARLGKIPPRILYVPASLQKKNSRGTYYVFLNKYYYWMKSNGYFYLDEHYYK